jgi:hypothetical protein
MEMFFQFIRFQNFFELHVKQYLLGSNRPNTSELFYLQERLTSS